VLESFVRENPGRLAQLIRPPFASPARDNAGQSMQMPPFMRNSNARALSLARWQYDLLMTWVVAVTEPGEAAARGPAPDGELAPLSPEAAERQRRVLATLDASAEAATPGEDGDR
jgi:hypothetical protein